MLTVLKKILTKIENTPIKPWQLLAWFYFVTLGRTLLEGITDSGGHLSGFQSFFLQYPAYYAAVFSALIIIFYLITYEKIEKVAKITLLFSFFIFIGPIIDAVLPIFNNISYISVNNWELVMKSYLTIGLGGLYWQGTTLGIKIELLIALFFIALYLRAKGASWVKAISGSVISYFFIITTFLAPTFINFGYGLFNSEFNFSSQFLGLLWTTIAAAGVLIIFFSFDKKIFFTWLKAIDWFRTILVWLVMAWGTAVYFNQRFNPIDFNVNWPGYGLKAIAVAASGFLIWQIIRLINDLVDFDFDKFSNSPNLLNKLSKNDLVSILIAYLFFLILFSLQINYTFSVLILVYLLIGYFYSCRPIFFKRHFISTAISLSLNYVLAFWAGYSSFFTAADSLNLVPRNISLLIFLLFVAVIGFKDVKDEVSDKKQGVVTLVTRYGVSKAAKIISLMTILVIIFAAWLWQSWLLLLLALICFVAAHYVTAGFTIFKNKAAIITILISFSTIAPVAINFSQPTQAAIGKISLKNDSGWHPYANQEQWDISSLLTDQNGNNYFFSQSYSPQNGSSLTLIDLRTKKYYKEYFPDKNLIAVTKNKLAINQYIPGYNDSNVFYDNGRGTHILRASFADGVLDVTVSGIDNGDIITTTPDGVMALKNGQKLNYYSQPNLTANGRLIFAGQEILNVSGPFWLEHRWGNIQTDFRQLDFISANLDDETKITIAYFGYENGSLAYGGIFKDGKMQNFNQLTIRVDQNWESPTTKQKWPTKLNLANDNINLDLEAILPNQEIPQLNTWAGPMTINGKISDKQVSGWANFSEIRSQ